ncbi:caspase family protein [Pseudomonas chengduensis]|nr:caspase family protein [Pseudomonas chengduensis]MDH1731273.1 caspase family protein [Pseudomonas chengduensis]
MRDIRFLLKTHYAQSHALIIGINKYAQVSPLAYAVNDAEEIRELLVTELDFPAQNVTCLLDEQATKDEILKAYFRYANEDVGLDDRLFVFFAGHGHTVTGSRGEIGFLVPHDATLSDLSTFVRWDDLTKNSELIRAKHILFVMDACYGGLALTRNTRPGSTRFLKDMLLRHSRQVLTAGKANEVVSDAGGPLPGHSVFTGYLIEALRGSAASDGGVITASGVMAYVYNKVASDHDSNQTPHYGHLDGDGDFIFKAPGLSDLENTEDRDLDRLVSIPYPAEIEPNILGASKAQRAKTLLANESSAIELHDFMITEVRQFLANTSEEVFPLSGQFDQTEFMERLARYELASHDLSVLLTVTSYWARKSHIPLLQKCLARSCDRMEIQSGLRLWLELRMYPLIIETYCAGIAAVDAKNYESLAAVLYVPVSDTGRSAESNYLVEAIGNCIAELNRMEIWKIIPGHERHYTPHSEYLFKTLQPRLDDLLFLGKDYEQAFDTFEVLLALAVADMNSSKGKRAWGPIGRFGWKHSHNANPPLSRVLAEAKELGASWPPLRAGLFGGDQTRFEKAAEEYSQIIAGLHWY